ncbi:DUF72 domain-containing protein [Frankia sp. AiPs1]|uniref:DUF72 domain-containing protein n=1 Tax=Frankia sp. AiPa1 TaxID=573492 RepID=UPI00202B8643|nr:DUF72 domain-containing protein [Frankia sp. AiPa1]MCL9760482.1 DUF72 domain-containing protein [Frankia sp. AiPa1]
MRLHVGCAMWTHSSWNGRYFPPALPAAVRLRHYASWCTAVEGNTTFYAIPSPDTARSWARQTDEDFRFVLKLPKLITHDQRLTDVGVPLRAFLGAAEPLGPRLEAIWLQFPPAFTPVDVPALAAFLRRLPRTYRYAVEVRHPAFFTDPDAALALERMLLTMGAEWIPFDTTAFFASPPTSDAERDAWAKKPRMPLRARALTDRPIIRYLGRDDAARTAEGWQRWADLCAEWLREGRSPTVFIHTPDNADAPRLARQFHDDVRSRVPYLDLASLPSPLPASPPTLF